MSTFEDLDAAFRRLGEVTREANDSIGRINAILADSKAVKEESQ